MATDPIDEQAIWNALRSVVDPELGSDIVDLGMVSGISIGTGVVTVEVALTIAGCPLRKQIRTDVEKSVLQLLQAKGVAEMDGKNFEVNVDTVTMDKEERAAIMSKARKIVQERASTTNVPMNTRVLALSSGKGGVGKSSVTANLAIALAGRGFTVGVLDADIWGFSIPRLLGIQGEMHAEEKKIVPLERRVGTGLLKVVSMGFLSDEEDAIMWRGMLLARAVQQFLEEVRWGDLDYLLVDMPPGTGDVQMAIARLLPRTELIVVTTPSVTAYKVAQRAVSMAIKGHLRLVGIIENMAHFKCEHGEVYYIFGSGGGESIARESGAPLLAKLPVAIDMGDTGVATGSVYSETGSAENLAREFAELARVITEEVAPPIEMSGCTANMLASVEKALAGKKNTSNNS
jgi:ATP-binding protein involved in chromosome partitioning